jgi:hypothetical protein
VLSEASWGRPPLQLSATEPGATLLCPLPQLSNIGGDGADGRYGTAAPARARTRPYGERTMDAPRREPYCRFLPVEPFPAFQGTAMASRPGVNELITCQVRSFVPILVGEEQ